LILEEIKAYSEINIFINNFKNNWVLKLLDNLIISESLSLDLTAQPHILRKKMDSAGIAIINYESISAVQVSYKSKVIGEIGQPTISLQEDGKYKAKIEHWTVFD
jgi:hypothetical protein